MHSSCLPAPRLLDPLLEGNYTTAEVAAGINSAIAEFAESLDWDFQTLAGCAGLTPASAAVGAELLATIRRCSDLARALELIAR
jgi:hypothetical protein